MHTVSVVPQIFQARIENCRAKIEGTKMWSEIPSTAHSEGKTKRLLAYARTSMVYSASNRRRMRGSNNPAFTSSDSWASKFAQDRLLLFIPQAGTKPPHSRRKHMIDHAHFCEAHTESDERAILMILSDRHDTPDASRRQDKTCLQNDLGRRVVRADEAAHVDICPMLPAVLYLRFPRRFAIEDETMVVRDRWMTRTITSNDRLQCAKCVRPTGLAIVP